MPHWKTLLLNLYYHASRPYRWRRNRRGAAVGRAPVVVLFYHRIADDGAGSWTVSNAMFARQIDWLQAHFELVSLQQGQRRLRDGKNPRPCVSITFDDGYAENCHQAIPLLIKRRIPCTYFVTLQNVLEGRPFEHDVALGNRCPPNTLEQLRAMAAAGVEIGAHGRNHVDLGGTCDTVRLYDEVVTAGEQLQEEIARRVRYFAFPFGQYMNLNSKAFAMAARAGYEAVCSAYGGYNFPGDDPFHLQRIHVDNDMIRLKNHATVDPRKSNPPRFQYEAVPLAASHQLPSEWCEAASGK